MTFSIDQLLQAWDEQQSAYIAHRELRFGVALDVLAATYGDGFHVLDIGCGPGSFSQRVLSRFPTAQVTAVDLDPLMLTLAREGLKPYGDRVQFIQADMASPEAFQAISGAPQAAISSTAIHWLLPEQQAALYRTVYRLLADDGLFLNADHQRFDARHPRQKALAEQHDSQTQAQAWARGVMDWDSWFEAVGQLPSLKAAMEARAQIFADRPAPLPTPVDFHLALLRQAGFAEAGTLWQFFDDYLIGGWKQNA